MNEVALTNGEQKETLSPEAEVLANELFAEWTGAFERVLLQLLAKHCTYREGSINESTGCHNTMCMELHVQYDTRLLRPALQAAVTRFAAFLPSAESVSEFAVQAALDEVFSLTPDVKAE